MTDSPAQPTSTKSPMRTAIIVLLAVVVLAGGAFVAYKLTNKRDTGEAFQTVARKVEKAAASGDQATVNSFTTVQGKNELAAVKGELDGLVAGPCGPAPFVKDNTKQCIFTRPGGQLSLFLTTPKGKWLVSSAKLGPAAVTPTAPPTPPTS